jgi:hypothetical protein
MAARNGSPFVNRAMSSLNSSSNAFCNIAFLGPCSSFLKMGIDSAARGLARMPFATLIASSLTDAGAEITRETRPCNNASCAVSFRSAKRTSCAASWLDWRHVGLGTGGRKLQRPWHLGSWHLHAYQRQTSCLISCKNVSSPVLPTWSGRAASTPCSASVVCHIKNDVRSRGAATNRHPLPSTSHQLPRIKALADT